MLSTDGTVNVMNVEYWWDSECKECWELVGQW